DLRFNVGGLMEGAIKVADLFIEEGVLVTVRPRREPSSTYVRDRRRAYILQVVGRGDGPLHRVTGPHRALATDRGKRPGGYLAFPMVCLVNRASASGGELLSACLQDHKRAVILGERTFGKASVQRTYPFRRTGGLLKVTRASWWRP